jgi:hypothetical protein
MRRWFETSVTSNGPLQLIAESILESEVEAGTAEGSMEPTKVEPESAAGTQLLRPAPPSVEQPERPKTTFTFRAQLTWGLAPGTRVHLPSKFSEWMKATSKHIPDFVLLPFEDEKGQGITTSDQIPNNNLDFFNEYFYNHRVLRHGNLMGMVHFSCTVSWNKVKRMQDLYFQWMHQHKVYINLTMFKSATLVICGFFVGAHPGHLHRDDAEKEIRDRLQLPEAFPFQLTSRTSSLPRDSSKESERCAFPAVAIETSARQAKKLREAFFALPPPSEAKVDHPYTGCYQFVPTLQSTEWPLHKIFQLAKVHVKICDNLKAIYVQTLQNIWNEIGSQGHTLMRGFLGMQHKRDGITHSIVHSAHNTSRPNIKAVLVPAEYYDVAIDKLASMHQSLLSGVPQIYHKNVFVEKPRS